MLRRRVLVVVSAVGAVLIVLAGPARAHVTIDPDEAARGGFATVRFRVPNERNDAATTSLEVEFPTDNPIPSARIQPVAGWTATVETAPAPGAPESGEGGADEPAEMVTRITWTGGAIQPGQFEEFPVSMGPLPDDADQLLFPAIQTYDSGEVVRWIEETPPSGEEPESPAPVLTLTAGDEAVEDPDNGASETAADDSDDDDDGNTLAVVALVVGALGLLTGIGALVMGRRATS
ncbi:MAG: YcnI family protein [Acidimicrobiia bacterium]